MNTDDFKQKNKIDNHSIVLIGPVASGKGTISTLLSSTFDLTHICIGDLLRKNNLIEDDGKLTPDELVLPIIEEALIEAKFKNFVLDGFPRTIEQALELDELLRRNNAEITSALFFEIGDAEILGRCTGRLIHPSSGRTYHVTFSPPKLSMVDDITGEPLVKREDDKPEIVSKRIKIYKDTEPLLRQFYSNKKVYKPIKCCNTSTETFMRVEAALGEEVLE